MWATKANNYCLFQFKEAIFIITFESEDEKTFIVTSPTTFFLLPVLLSYTLTSVCMLSIHTVLYTFPNVFRKRTSLTFKNLFSL